MSPYLGSYTKGFKQICSETHFSGHTSILIRKHKLQTRPFSHSLQNIAIQPLKVVYTTQL
jgi:hypothetical protein